MALIAFESVVRVSGTATSQGHAQQWSENLVGTADSTSLAYGNALVDGQRSIGGAAASSSVATLAVHVEQAAQPSPAVSDGFARGNAGIDGEWTLQAQATSNGYAWAQVTEAALVLEPLGALGADDSGYAVGTASLEPLQVSGNTDLEGEPTYEMGELVFPYILGGGSGPAGWLGDGGATLEPLAALGADDTGYAQAAIAFEPLTVIGYETFIDIEAGTIEQPSTTLTAEGEWTPQGGVFVQPTSTISSRGAGQANLTQPQSELDADGTMPLWGRARLAQPRAALTAGGDTEGFAQARLVQPHATLQGYSAGRAALQQPSSTLTADGDIEILGHAPLVQPQTRLEAGGTIELNGDASLVQPSSELSDTALVILAQPTTRLVAAGSIDVDEPVYGAYAVNLSNGGFTEYDNFPIQQVVRFRGEYYGVGPTGLFRLENGLGDEDQVDVVIESGLSDFGDTVRKRISYVYVVTNAVDNVTLEAVTGDGHPARGRTARKTERDGVHVRRAQFGRGVQSTYWGMNIKYAGSERIRIYKLEPLVEPLRRKAG